MKHEEIIKLKINDIIYNKETKQIVKMASEINKDYENIKQIAFITCIPLKTGGVNTVMMRDYDKWELVDDNAPVEIRFELLQFRFLDLEQFVHSRLR